MESGVSILLDPIETVHVSLLLICKSQTVTGLRRSNIYVLSKVELSVKFREKVKTMNTAIDTFI